MSRTRTNEEFIEKAIVIHGNRYDYSKVNYTRSSLDVEIICLEHGSFWQRPDNHLSGKGCRTCAFKISAAAASLNNKYHYNYDIINVENEITSYLLGAFITDGCIHRSKSRPNARSLSLDSQDYDWLRKIRDLICPELPIKKDRTCYRLYFTQIKFVDWFMSHGITVNKSLTAKVPLVPNRYLPDLVRGCVDGDGCVAMYGRKHQVKNGDIHIYNHPECYICSSSEAFIQELKTILVGVGLDPSVDRIVQNSSIIEGRILTGGSYLYKVRFCGKRANDFLQWAYYPEHKLSLSRKANIANDIHNMYLSKDYD